MDRQEEFEALFRSLIERHTPALTDRLRELVSTPPPAGMEVLLFVIFSDWKSFPIQAGAFNRRITEVSFEPPFCGPLLEGVEFIPLGAIDQEAFENDGVATYESGAVVAAEWFGECWHAAGGDLYPLPAFIEHHDAADAYDLARQCWIEEESIWE
jgi:hypothetical protein